MLPAAGVRHQGRRSQAAGCRQAVGLAVSASAASLQAHGSGSVADHPAAPRSCNPRCTAAPNKLQQAATASCAARPPTQAQVLQLVGHPRQAHRAQDIIQLAALVLPAQLPQLLARLRRSRGRGWRFGAWLGCAPGSHRMAAPSRPGAAAQGMCKRKTSRGVVLIHGCCKRRAAYQPQVNLHAKHFQERKCTSALQARLQPANPPAPGRSPCQTPGHQCPAPPPAARRSRPAARGCRVQRARRGGRCCAEARSAGPPETMRWLLRSQTRPLQHKMESRAPPPLSVPSLPTPPHHHHHHRPPPDRASR